MLQNLQRIAQPCAKTKSMLLVSLQTGWVGQAGLTLASRLGAVSWSAHLLKHHHADARAVYSTEGVHTVYSASLFRHSIYMGVLLACCIPRLGHAALLLALAVAG